MGGAAAGSGAEGVVGAEAGVVAAEGVVAEAAGDFDAAGAVGFAGVAAGAVGRAGCVVAGFVAGVEVQPASRAAAERSVMRRGFMGSVWVCVRTRDDSRRRATWICGGGVRSADNRPGVTNP